MAKQTFFWKTKKLFRNFSNNIFESDSDSLLRQFFHTCERFKNADACIDSISGCLSYNDLKLSVIAVASYLRALPDKKIGIMLPASAGALISYFAVLLSGKLPVMINWTLGLRELKFIKDDIKLDTIITSSSFLARVQEKGFLTSLPFEVIYLEDIKSSFSIFKKLKFKFMSLLPSSRIFKLFKTVFKDDAIAVLLFTSGTEGKPKCVPLTHHNLISNQSAAWKRLEIKDGNEIFLSLLPPFHALGFNITCLLPLLSGLRIVFEANPLNGKKVARSVEEYEITILCLTPTFFSYLLHGVKDPSQFKSVGLVVLGGEAAVSWYYDVVRSLNPQTEIIQGYGVTECSPVITIVPQHSSLPGVGLPIENMEIAVVNPDSLVRVPPGERGLILVRGDSLFQGYLLPDGSFDQSAFIDFEEDKWYRTGDLGIIDGSGSLLIKGRQKRFVKIGGEMVSLAAIEDILNESFKDKLVGVEGPGLAVCGVECPGEKTKLYLFTKFSVTFDEVNGALKDAATSSLIKISYVKQLSDFPLLGIGKIDYTLLSGMIEKLDCD